MRIVIRLGGSVIGSPVNTKLIDEYVRTLQRMKEDKHELAVVVGGGDLARDFIKIAKELGLETPDQDEIAIWVSRLYAQLLAKVLRKSGCGRIPFTVEEAAKCLRSGKIAIMGGLKPGMTTDTVAARLAKSVGAELIIKATNQEGVFDKDPRKHPEARKIDHMKFSELAKVLEETKHAAGIHQIVDPEAAKMLTRIDIRMVVVNGFDAENLLKAAKGEPTGTWID